MIEQFIFAWRSLSRKRGRTLLTVLGIVIGVASVTIIGNIAQCGSTALNTEMDSLGLSGLTISATASASLEQESLETIEACEQVEQAMPVMMQTGSVSARSQETDALLWGIDENANRIISLQVLYGRGLNHQDVVLQKKVCLIDEAFSQAAFGRSNSIGKTVSLLCGGVQETYTIIGIVKTGSGLLQSFIGSYIPSFIYLPYTSMQSSLGRHTFDQIAVRIQEGEDADEVGQTLASSLNRNTGIQDGYVSNNLVKQKDSLTNMLNILTLVLSAVGAVSLLVASLSIMTVMLVSVHERTREIGIKKAIGARKGKILLEFLWEALMISCIGAVLGAGIGTGLSFVGAAAFGVTLQARMDIALFAALFSILSGVIFGVYPAMKASSLQPIDALHTDS